MTRLSPGLDQDRSVLAGRFGHLAERRGARLAGNDGDRAHDVTVANRAGAQLT